MLTETEDVVDQACVCCGENVHTTDDGIPFLNVVSDDFQEDTVLYGSKQYQGVKWDEIHGPICNTCVGKVHDLVDWNDDAGQTIRQSDWERAGFVSPLS